VSSLCTPSETCKITDAEHSLDQFGHVGEMHDYLKQAVQTLIDNWVELVDHIFSDPDQVYGWIHNGLLWDPGNLTSPEDVRPTLEHSLWAYMMPHAWATTNVFEGGPLFIA
jgi:hypothetical protein